MIQCDLSVLEDGSMESTKFAAMDRRWFRAMERLAVNSPSSLVATSKTLEKSSVNSRLPETFEESSSAFKNFDSTSVSMTNDAAKQPTTGREIYAEVF